MPPQQLVQETLHQADDRTHQNETTNALLFTKRLNGNLQRAQEIQTVPRNLWTLKDTRTCDSGVTSQSNPPSMLYCTRQQQYLGDVTIKLPGAEPYLSSPAAARCQTRRRQLDRLFAKYNITTGDLVVMLNRISSPNQATVRIADATNQRSTSPIYLYNILSLGVASLSHKMAAAPVERSDLNAFR